MQLNLNQLEILGRIEAVRRQLGKATELILNGAAPDAINTMLGAPSGDLAEARNELLPLGRTWNG